jgi:hypothetical protein
MHTDNKLREHALRRQHIFDARVVKTIGVNFDEDYYVGTYITAAERGVVLVVRQDETVVAVVNDAASLTDDAVEEIERAKTETFLSYRARFPISGGGSSQPVERLDAMKEAATVLAELIIETLPPSRERRLALLKLEEVMHWANAAVASAA